MTITISKSLLLSKMQLVSKIIPSKSTTPALCNFLFETKEGRLFITGANDEGRIRTSVECLFDEELTLCVPTSIVEGLKTLPEQPINVHINPDNLSILVRYQGGKFEVAGYSTNTYPQKKEITTLETISITAEELYSGISKVINFASESDLRPILDSVLLEAKQGCIFFVATDGNGLGVMKKESPNFTYSISIVISRAIASIIKSIIPLSDDSLTFRVGKDWSEVLIPDCEISFRQQEGRYPNWRSVVPKENNLELLVNTEQLISAIKRTAVFTNKISGLISMKIEPEQLILSAQDLDFSTSAEEKMPATFNKDKFHIGFKGSRIQEMLACIDTERSRFTFSDPSKAILITPEIQSENEELTYLLMPITIQ